MSVTDSLVSGKKTDVLHLPMIGNVCVSVEQNETVLSVISKHLALQFSDTCLVTK